MINVQAADQTTPIDGAASYLYDSSGDEVGSSPGGASASSTGDLGFTVTAG